MLFDLFTTSHSGLVLLLLLLLLRFVVVVFGVEEQKKNSGSRSRNRSNSSNPRPEGDWPVDCSPRGANCHDCDSDRVEQRLQVVGTIGHHHLHQLLAAQQLSTSSYVFLIILASSPSYFSESIFDCVGLAWWRWRGGRRKRVFWFLFTFYGSRDIQNIPNEKKKRNLISGWRAEIVQ